MYLGLVVTLIMLARYATYCATRSVMKMQNWSPALAASNTALAVTLCSLMSGKIEDLKVSFDSRNKLNS